MKPWIWSRNADSFFILAPAFAASLAAFFLPRALVEAPLSPVSWFVFVVLIDVAHVYGTLFRTIFAPEEWRQLKSLTLMIALSCWSVGVLLYLWGPEKFWRVLAYVAVFHFIRQQFGFMRVYSRGEVSRPWFRLADAAFVYAATGYPLLYWHVKGDRAFSWFVKDDFFSLEGMAGLLPIGLWLLALATLAYGAREVAARRLNGRWNGPRFLIALGTGLVWHVGIVAFNSDFVFTMTNVIAHGLPYMALTWMYARSENLPIARRYFACVFLAVITLAAIGEEGLWKVTADFDATTLTWLVPLLAIPQATHYVLDGFIWTRARYRA